MTNDPSEFPYGDLSEYKDIGSLHYIRPLNAYQLDDDLPDPEAVVGVIIAHKTIVGQWCAGILLSNDVEWQDGADSCKIEFDDNNDIFNTYGFFLCPNCSDFGKIARGKWERQYR